MLWNNNINMSQYLSQFSTYCNLLQYNSYSISTLRNLRKNKGEKQIMAKQFFGRSFFILLNNFEAIPSFQLLIKKRRI